VSFLFEGGDEFFDAFDEDGDVAEAEGVGGGVLGVLVICGVMEFDDFEVELGVRGLEHGEFGSGIFERCNIVEQLALHFHFADDFEAEMDEERDGGREVVDDDADVVDVSDFHR
jgi:hypothetical protein